MKLYNQHKGIAFNMHYRLFKKQRINILLLTVFMLAGLYGIYQGFAFKQKQLQTIDAFRSEKLNVLQELKAGFTTDTTKPEGKAAYKKATGIISSNWNIVLPAGKPPASTAIFNIGQADIFPYYYTIKNESFFMQLFKQGEIANPLRSIAGHFDISFWIIYLLPLLIVVLCFNILSAESDNGNWKLISSQGISARQWVLSKCLLIGLIAGIIVIFLFIVGLALNYGFFKQPPSVNDFLFLIMTGVYLIFWLAVVYAINAYAKNASSAALAGGISWIALCFIIPTLVTTIAEKTIPVDNTLVSRMSRRPQGSKFEDTVFAKQTIAQLGILLPQYKHTTLRPQSPAFGFATYMSYHELMDNTNKIAVQDYFRHIEQRQQVTNITSIINPAAGIDGMFAHLAANDAQANHDFIWQAKALHQALHDVYFPPLFFEKQLTKDDYERLPLFSYKPAEISAAGVLTCTELLFSTAFIFLLSNRRLKKKW
ncbi:MAG: ABC transporter permease subunit [Agriterribacter sp.]